MRIRKNYYDFSFGRYCGVTIDEATMKKVSKLQYETREKLLDILENSENVYALHWGISDEPSDMSQDDRTFNYIDDNYEDDLKTRLSLTRDMFNIRKAKDLYKVDGEYTKSRNLAEQQHTEFLMKGE